MRRHERTALLVTSLASFLTPFMGAATNVALPAIAREFSANAIQLTWVSAAYLVAAAACLLPFGRLADLHGRKRVFAWGLLAFAATSWLCAETTSIQQLIAARALQGSAGAMMFGTNVAILTSVFPPARRGTALGWNVAAVYVGLSLGPFLGGLLVEQVGWRSIFALNVPLGVVALAFTVWALEGEWAEAHGESFDLVGSGLYAAALAIGMYGLSRLPARSGWLALAAGVTLVATFVRRELLAAQPILDLRFLARNRVFMMGSLAALINYSATFAVGFLLSLYLQYVRGLSPQAAGAVLVSQPIVMTIISPLAGRLADRTESRNVASLGMAVVAAGIFPLAFVGGRTPIALVIAALVILGAGFGLFSSPNTNAVMGSIGRSLYGVASALLATMRLTGQMLSMAVAMLALAAFAGQEPLSPEHHAGLDRALRAAFLLFGVFCTAGVFASLARGPERPAPRSD
jgi:EmrB/QacA subfamily drug resistance transporter